MYQNISLTSNDDHYKIKEVEQVHKSYNSTNSGLHFQKCGFQEVIIQKNKKKAGDKAQ